MLKKILRGVDRTITILTIIVLPFFLYFVVTEYFITPSAAKIFDTCYRHQQENPADNKSHADTFAPLLAAIKDDVSIAWHLDAPFGKPDEGRAQLKDVSAEDGNLILRFDWKDTTFRLKPVVDDEVDVKFQGTWENAEQNGCAMLELPTPKIWSLIIADQRMNAFAHGMTYDSDDVSAGWPFSLYRPTKPDA